jgi:hypothetical protein
MTDSPSSLAPETVDELLSAELDDEFDAAARDLGFEPDAARAALASVPGVESRREALGRARDALAVLPEIDELTAQRLRSNALRAGTRADEETRRGRRGRRWQRTAAVATAVAAAAAVVVGIAALSSRRSDTSKTAAQSNAAPPKAAPASAPRASGPVQAYTTAYNLGAVPDVDALTARVQATQRSAPLKNAAAKSPAFSGAGGTTGTSDQSYAEASGSALRAAGSDTVQLSLSCDVKARAFAGVAAAPALRATATLAGTPVIVEVFIKDPRSEVLVVLTSDCHLVNLRALAAS